MKRITAFVLAALLTLSLLAACGEKEPETHKTTTGFEEFEITYFWGPQGSQVTNRTFWEIAAEAGFTSVPIENPTAAENKIALGYLKELGLTCSALADSRISRLLSRSYDDDKMDEVIKEVAADYAEYADVIKGWWLKDEPNSDAEFAKLKRVVAAFRRVDPERNTFINLLPYWGIPPYEWAVDGIEPHYVCYDHYTLLADGTMKSTHYQTAEAIRKVALDRGLDYMNICLLAKHMDYADLTRAQILWEVNVALTYGCKRVSYFTFMLPVERDKGWDNAVVDIHALKMPHFDDVKAINALIMPLGKELFKKDSTAVFQLETDPDTIEAYCTAYESYGNLGKVSGDDFLIGFFSDDSFMITNKRWQEGDAGKNTVVFEEITSGLQYFDVKSSSWKNYNAKNAEGKYVYNPEAGEGLLFRVK